MAVNYEILLALRAARCANFFLFFFLFFPPIILPSQQHGKIADFGNSLVLWAYLYPNIHFATDIFTFCHGYIYILSGYNRRSFISEISLLGHKSFAILVESNFSSRYNWGYNFVCLNRLQMISRIYTRYSNSYIFLLNTSLMPLE